MKSYQCEYTECALVYSSKYNLSRHTAIFHLGIRWTCSTCGRQLSSAQSLQDHEFCHTGEKPYLCKHPGCPKRYRQASQLSVHKKKHMKAPKRNDKIVAVLKVSFYIDN